jgi:hypothetical protein
MENNQEQHVPEINPPQPQYSKSSSNPEIDQMQEGRSKSSMGRIKRLRNNKPIPVHSCNRSNIGDTPQPKSKCINTEPAIFRTETYLNLSIIIKALKSKRALRKPSGNQPSKK